MTYLGDSSTRQGTRGGVLTCTLPHLWSLRCAVGHASRGHWWPLCRGCHLDSAQCSSTNRTWSV